MPSRCCVPQCRSNYDGEQIFSVFKFPEYIDLRQKWIRSIPRQNFCPTKASKVCELHFAPSDVERETSMFDMKTGRKLGESMLQI